MGKFDGILLCSDMDGTLLDDEKRLSPENRTAIEYFMQEGGLFSYSTGRTPLGVALDRLIMPNAPMICFNGCGILDCSRQEMLWSISLDKRAAEVLEYIEEKFPESGIEVFTERDVYFCRDNDITKMHRAHEQLADHRLDYHLISTDWKKLLFASAPETTARLSKALLESPFAARYHLVESDQYYFEVLPKNASKGAALIKLCEMLAIDPKKTIAIGDSYNDLEIIQAAGLGVAVANAVPPVRAAADFITVDNNSSAVAAVIRSLEFGLLQL